MNNTFFSNHQLTADELLLIPEAFYQLVMARIKVSVLKSQQYLPKVKNKKAPAASIKNFEMLQTIATVINGLSFRTPWPSTCLVRVIAAHKMLCKREIPHVLHFGVQINSNKEIKAHAWLSAGSKILVGGENAAGFKELSTIVI